MDAPRKSREAGLTMVEIMVSLLLVAIAAAFIFSIQVRTSQALRDQTSVSEVQQTLRAASDVIVRDLRQAGFLATVIKIANEQNTASPFVIQGIVVTNSSSGPDTLQIQYADTEVSAKIKKKEHGDGVPSFHSSETEVDSNVGFSANDIVLAVYTRPGSDLYAWGCMLEVTKTQGTDRIQHHPGTSIWNVPANEQCEDFKDVWEDYPYMIFVRAAIRLYRIKPSDPRGILQVSPSAGRHADDWVDIAVGIVDLQVALRVYQELGVDDNGDGNRDDDGDGDPERDWVSGDNLHLWSNERIAAGCVADDDVCVNKALTASVTLVAKTTKEITGPILDKTADIFEGDEDHRSNNKVGDHPGTTLPVTDTTSMYYGNPIFRSYTSTVDMRNLGIGE
jgi:type II secretory pathway pseudopilin PulG